MPKKKSKKYQAPNTEKTYRQELYIGQKGFKGQPFYYDELKQRTSIMLTPTSIKILDDISEEEGISRSELIERWARQLGISKND